MKTLKLITIISLVMFQANMIAQTLHIVVFCDTNDKKIGVNKESERKITLNEMETVSAVLGEYGYDSEMYEYHGNYCNKSNLLKVVKGLEIVPEKDVVFFYYGGHGSRAMNNDEDPFPQMCLGEDYEENWVPATLVKNIIMKKNPRLAIILTGCCNKEDAGVSIKSVVSEAAYTQENSIDKAAYKKLFLDATGLVMMTSSKAGQYSYSGKEGGVFCLYFWHLMEMVGEGKMIPDWTSLCDAVKRNVADVPINTRSGVVHQEPYYEVTPKGSTPNPITKKNTTRTVTINNQSSSLMNDINNLLNQTLSKDQRLRMIDGILAKHFTSGAKVITKGRNMTTNVDYEDAEVFLRRIALSPFIKQINVISEEGGDKKTQIIVHEVRNN